jgi:CRISPR-associated protein Csx14
MTEPDSAFRVHVDPRNPAEFFACCGLLEIADRLWDGAEGWFIDEQFCLAPELASRSGTLVDLLHTLACCAIQVANGSDTNSVPDAADAESPGDIAAGKIDPLRFGGDGTPLHIRLDWWVSVTRQSGKIVARPTVWKLWAGQQSSLSIATTLQQALARQLVAVADGPCPDILQQREMLSGRFGFDPGAAWNALDVGFSPNEQGMRVATSPAAELLSGIGLQRFMPPSAGTKRTFTYCTWGVPLPPAVAKVASAGLLSKPARRFSGGFTSRGSYKGLEYSTEIQGDAHE